MDESPELHNLELEVAAKTDNSIDERSGSPSPSELKLRFSYMGREVEFDKISGLLTFVAKHSSDLEKTLFITELRRYLKSIGKKRLENALAMIQPETLKVQLEHADIETIAKNLDTILPKSLRLEIFNALSLLQQANAIIKVVSKQDAQKMLLELYHDYGHRLFDAAMAKLEDDELKVLIVYAFNADEKSVHSVLSKFVDKKLLDKFLQAYKYIHAEEVFRILKLHAPLSHRHVGLWHVNTNFFLEFYQALRGFVDSSKGKFSSSQLDASSTTPSVSPAEFSNPNLAANLSAKQAVSKASKEEKKVAQEPSTPKNELLEILDDLIAEAEKENKAKQIKLNNHAHSVAKQTVN